jgi:hypothetical protein
LETFAASTRADSKSPGEQHDYRVAYASLGDMVFMLLITPWTIADFDVERDLETLLALEADHTTEDGLIMTWSRFLIVAEKPTAR